MRKKITIIAAIILVLPSLALAAYKPSRVIFPQINDVVCEAENICIEDTERLSEAFYLTKEAYKIASYSLGKFDFEPRYIFCSTQQCYESFGFSKSRASNVGKQRIVIGPRGWSTHILAHELIHHWQNHKLGTISVLFGEQWIIEGMAYELSNDPRMTLSEPWQSYRNRYRDWEKSVDKSRYSSALKNEV